MDKDKITIIFETVWPSIKKALDEIFYFLINLVKAIVRIAINQIKNF